MHDLSFALVSQQSVHAAPHANMQTAGTLAQYWLCSKDFLCRSRTAWTLTAVVWRISPSTRCRALFARYYLLRTLVNLPGFIMPADTHCG